MADAILTTGELLADPEGKPVERAAPEEPRGAVTTTLSPAEEARARAAWERQSGAPGVTPPPAQVLKAPTLRPVVPPPPVGEPWESRTPYAGSKSAAAAAWKGLADPALGAAQFASKAPPIQAAMWAARKMGADVSKDPVGDIADSFHEYIAPQHPELSPKTEIAGAVVNPVGLGTGAALTAAKLGMLKSGAIAGLAGGMSLPVDTIKDYWGTKLGDMGWGGATGFGLAGIAGLVGKAAAPAVQKAIETLKEQGVKVQNLTFGELLGGRAQSFENWVKNTLPGSGIGPAQERAAAEIRVAPIRKAGAEIGHVVDEKAPTSEQIAAIVGSDAGGIKVPGAVDLTYDKARAMAPALGIEMAATPLATQQGFRASEGSMRTIVPIMKKMDQWKVDYPDAGGPGAAQQLKKDLEVSLKPFQLDPAAGVKKFYGTSDELHDSIKYLNGRIDDMNKIVSAGGSSSMPKQIAKPYMDSLLTMRNHLRSLWEKTDPTGYEVLRAADKVHGSMQPLIKAAAAAAKERGAFTPDQLLTAGAKGEIPRSTATGSNDYQRYSNAAKDVLDPENVKRSGLGSLIHTIGTKGVGAAGAVGAGGSALMGHPAIAASLAGLYGAGVGASRLAYNPSLRLANRYVTTAYPERQALRTAIERLPSYLGGISGDTSDAVPEYLGGRRKRGD